MPTTISIVNQAILRVGEAIVTEGEYAAGSTKAARVIASLYAQCKEEVLKAYHWRAALVGAKLSPYELTEAAADTLYGITLAGAASYNGPTFRLRLNSAGTHYIVSPVIKFDFQYAIPDDCVRIRMATDEYGDLIQYDVAGAYVQSSENPVYLFYTSALADTELPSDIAHLIALRVAWAACAYLGASDILPDIRAEYGVMLRGAKNLDAQQDASRSFDSGDWLIQRLRGSVGAPYPGLG